MIAMKVVVAVIVYFMVCHGSTRQIPADVSISLNVNINSPTTNSSGFRDNIIKSNQISVRTQKPKRRTLNDGVTKDPGK